MLTRVSKGQPFSIVLGRDYFFSRFKAAGSWEAWAREIACGVDYLTRAPLFKAILVPHGPIGAGTAKIVRESLSARKPVFAFDENGAWAPVRDVVCVDPEDWQSGSRLILVGENRSEQPPSPYIS